MQIFLIASAHKKEGLGHVLRTLEITKGLKKLNLDEIEINMIIFSKDIIKKDFEEIFKEVKEIKTFTRIEKLNQYIQSLLGIYQKNNYLKSILIVDSISLERKDIKADFKYTISLSPIGLFNFNSDLVISEEL